MQVQLAEWVKRTRASRAIPLPGDVDAITGGPPCQGVSGLNRHSKQTDIINDPRCAATAR
jgi:DNA (cytosine-5)-methyltransferase 1